MSSEVKITTCYMCACRAHKSGHRPVLGAAFVLQYAGLLAERWYFFAEAKHPQNLYYQAIA